MERPTTTSLVDKLLLASVIAVVLTGVVVDQLDLNEFRAHSWSGYAMALLTAAHVGLHWKRQQPSVETPTASGTDSDDTVVEEGAAGAGQTRRISRRRALTSIAAAAGGATVGWFTRGAVSPAPFEDGDVGLFYHRESSLGLKGLLDALARWGTRPGRYKQTGEVVVALPSAAEPPTMSVAQAISQRRSLRQYADRPLTSEELSWLVYAATGITGGNGYRTAPSAGALYPIETYVAVDRVDGIEPGLYHVDVREQGLELVVEGSVAGDVMLAGLGQGFLRDAPVVFALTGLFQRTRWKYHQRHYRYVCWEAGHIAQNVYLAAEAKGLGACVVGAFLDPQLNGLLQVDGREEAALGLIAVGPR